MTGQHEALQRLLDATKRTGMIREEMAHRLSMNWPSLAACLADLLEAYDETPPRAFRSAAIVVRQLEVDRGYEEG